jgi:hypothetical protein
MEYSQASEFLHLLRQFERLGRWIHLPCHARFTRVNCPRFWEGGGSLRRKPGRKVRTPLGAMPRNSGLAGDTRGRNGGDAFRRTVPQRTYRRCRKAPVRVKRCGKSAPREAQATRHGKPHRVQGQIGNRAAARRSPRKRTGSGYGLLRQMILSVRKDADKIRLTALPKSLSSEQPFHPGPIISENRHAMRRRRLVRVERFQPCHERR